MKNGNWCVYIVKCSDGTLYTGVTNDLDRRIHEHNFSKKGAKYTKARRPVELVYNELVETKSDALKKEIAIKKLDRASKLELLKGKLDKNT